MKIQRNTQRDIEFSDSEYSEDDQEDTKWKYFITKQIINDVKEFINMY